METQLVKKLFPLGPRTALVIFILLLLAPGAFFPKLVVDNAPERYFPHDNPDVVFERSLREHFPNDQFIYVLLVGPEVYAIDNLRALASAAKRLEHDPRIERVLTVASTDHIRTDDFGFAVETLVDPRHLDDKTPAQWRQRVLSDRFAVDLLAGRDGESLAMMIRPFELDNSVSRMQIQTTVEEVLEEEGLGPLVAGMAGPVPLDVAQLQALIHDNLLFTPLTLGLVILLVWLLFRSWGVVLFTVLGVMAVGPLVVMLLIIAGRPFTLVDTMIPTLMLALTAALLVHLFSTLRMAHAAGRAGAEAVAWAVAKIRRPAFYASVTTALGLGSLGTSPILPIRDFGLAAAAGALIAYVVVIFILPPMIGRWFHSKLDKGGSGMVWVDAVVARIARIGIRRAAWVVAISGVFMVAAVPVIASIEVDTDILEFFAPEHPLSKATAEVEARIAGVTPVEIVINTEALDGLKQPALLQAMSGLRDWLEAQQEIDRVVSVNDIVEEMNWAFHAEDPAYLSIPDDHKLIAQYLLLYDGRDLFDVVNRDYDTARMVMSVNVHETSQVVALMDRIRAKLADTDLNGAQARLAGFGLLLAEQEGLLITGQLRGLAVALLTILIALAVVFRSLSAALLCMLPNLAPIIGMFFIMGILGWRLDIATALIAAVALGVAVDDTIHFYSGYQGTRRRGHGALRSLLHSFRYAGRAVMATTVILAFTFALFGLSEFRPTQNFGFLTMVGLIGALLMDLLLLPALIILGNRKSR